MAELQGDCFWFPNLSKCDDEPASDPVPTDPTTPVDPTTRTGVAEDEYINPWYGQLTYYTVAAWNLIIPGMI